MVKIIGVDFSGRDTNNTTWVTEAVLQDDCLKIESCRHLSKNGPESRRKLKCLLRKLPDDSVAALDFPFSVPIEFARFWQPDARQMPDLWAAMERDSFSAKQVEFVGLRWEQKRSCDPPESKSPLKKGRPNMLPMTIQGMKFLDCLWHCPTVQVSVLPLPAPSPHGSGHRLTLLEVMPGATLRSLRLPYTGYKGKAQDAKECRGKILNKLPQLVKHLAAVQVIGLSERGAVYKECRESDDALDAVVAAITAALWVKSPACFPHPPTQDRPEYQVSLLEGWLFMPYRITEAKK